MSSDSPVRPTASTVIPPISPTPHRARDAAAYATDAASPAEGGERVVRRGTGLGGLERVVVTTPDAHAEIYLQGAHVTAWAPTGAQSVVWTSSYSAFAPGAAIRGGVPICFPWFGPDPSGDGPLHGLVRTRPWSFSGWTAQGDDVVLRFTLSSADVPEAAQPFELQYVVTVGARLELALVVANTGTESLHFEEALHTYLAVSDVGETRIDGLGDLDRVDRLSGRQVHTPADAVLRVVTETDHLYVRPGPVTVADWSVGRAVRITTRGAENVVIWNPWVDKAVAMADFGDDDWRRMLCVETANVADRAVSLPPSAVHTMVTRLELLPVV